jgi:hypothetical protein
MPLSKNLESKFFTCSLLVSCGKDVYLSWHDLPWFHKDAARILALIKVKFSLERAMKAQRGSRGIALLFL